MKLFTKLFLFLVAVTISLTSNTVVAQSEESGRLDIEEIIVTGTKRDISQQDVPVAVSTLTAKQLDNTFRNDVFALGQLAPNVTLTPQNGFNAIAGGMRGTGFPGSCKLLIRVFKFFSVRINIWLNDNP